jgi:hypothetical protein
MTYQFDPILGQGRDGAVSLAEQQKGFDAGSAAAKAAFQSSVSGACELLPSAADGPKNTARIQTLLGTGGEVVVTGVGYISGTLYVPSDTTLRIARDAVVTQAPGPGNIMVRSKVEPIWQVTQLTSTGITVSATIPGHNLVPGEYVAVDWAAEYGYSGVHRVHAVNGDVVTYYAYETPPATTATASATAATSPYSAGNYIQARRATVRPRVVIDGTLDYNNAGNSSTPVGINNFAVMLDHVYQPHIEASGVVRNARKYAFTLACFSAGTSGPIHVDTDSDGLHITGPVAGYSPSGPITGRSYDNIIGVGTGDYLAYLISEGSVIQCSLPDVHVEKHTVDAVRLFGADIYPMDVHIGKISGAMPGGAAVNLLRDLVVVPNGNAWSRNITVQHAGTSGTAYPVSIAHPRVDRFVANVGGKSKTTQVNISSTATNCGLIDITLTDQQQTTTSSAVSTVAGSVIRHLIVRGSWSSTMQSAAVVNIGGAVTRCDLTDFTLNKGFCAVRTLAEVANDIVIGLRGFSCTGPACVVDCVQASGTCTVQLNGVSISTTATAFRNSSAGTGKLVLSGSGATYNRASSAERTLSQSIECYTLDAPVDLAILSRVGGQTAWNSNASANNGADGAVGTGAFACVGTAVGSWRRLGTAGGAGNQY